MKTWIVRWKVVGEFSNDTCEGQDVFISDTKPEKDNL